LTHDGGAHWMEVAPGALPAALEGEGAFAASGTCVAVLESGEGKKKHADAWFVSGGAGGSRIFRTGDFGKTWQVFPLPLIKGKAATGAFSVAFSDEKNGVVVGGDYQAPA